MKQCLYYRLTFNHKTTTNCLKYSLSNEKQYFKLSKTSLESHIYQSKLEVNFTVDMWIKSFLIAEYSVKMEDYFFGFVEMIYDRNFD